MSKKWHLVPIFKLFESFKNVIRVPIFWIEWAFHFRKGFLSTLRWRLLFQLVLLPLDILLSAYDIGIRCEKFSKGLLNLKTLWENWYSVAILKFFECFKNVILVPIFELSGISLSKMISIYATMKIDFLTCSTTLLHTFKFL